LDEKLFELANKHRKNFEKSNLVETGYKMPEALDEEEDLEKKGRSLKDRRMKALTKRYEDV
jgi:hypothetical protein